jgi:hypothetical protein
VHALDVLHADGAKRAPAGEDVALKLLEDGGAVDLSRLAKGRARLVRCESRDEDGQRKELRGHEREAAVGANEEAAEHIELAEAVVNVALRAPRAVLAAKARRRLVRERGAANGAREVGKVRREEARAEGKLREPSRIGSGRVGRRDGGGGGHDAGDPRGEGRRAGAQAAPPGPGAVRASGGCGREEAACERTGAVEERGRTHGGGARGPCGKGVADRG